jgi:glucose-6-phosphate isomerase
MKTTLFMVISKSGGTLETVAQYAFFKEKFQSEVSEKFQDNFVVIA